FVTSSLSLMAFTAGIALLVIDLFVEPDPVEADSNEQLVTEQDMRAIAQLADVSLQTAEVDVIDTPRWTRNPLDGITFGQVRPFDKPKQLVGHLASKNELSRFSPAFVLTAVAEEVAEDVSPEDIAMALAAVEPTFVPVEITATATAAPTVTIETPTVVPTTAPTAVPTETPTAAPTVIPTAVPTDGTYTVQRGDSINSIATYLGVSVAILQEVNGLNGYSVIYPGDVLLIPEIKNLELASLGPLVWPVESRYIIKQYQYGHQAIDVVLPSGSPVVALAAGKVEYAGWNQNGYGYMVQIDHGNDVHTLYAHLSAFHVQSGDEVTQGQLLADSGNTGNSTMPHLHLEIRDGYQLMNPCLYLPDGC
ncbi:MAG: peptidoglycan DD-metalloendopeptidase family protein, partial [Anaerolineales bacterium]|nr:peptidoglycan DD-metalloendopeptidase family protein [Anaerolineales bacterium]